MTDKYIFDAKKEIENICEFIRIYYKQYNLKGAVLGISGGKDSAVVSNLEGKETIGMSHINTYSLLSDIKTKMKWRNIKNNYLKRRLLNNGNGYKTTKHKKNST